MKELVIGATGFIGAALMAKLPGAEGTARRPGATHVLDLLGPIDLPAADVIYVCAGANGAKACEGNQEAFRVNVDAPIEIAREAQLFRGHVVWISSMSVEWLSTAYQRQKLAAEGVLRLMPNVSVVRAGRVVKTNVDDLCDAMIAAGRSRRPGLVRWGNDELAYQK